MNYLLVNIMKMLSKWLLDEPKNLTASCFFWNMIGSLSLALGTMILTIIVNRIVGDYSGGDFAMALAAGQLMATVGYFELRTFQVTDTKKIFSFSNYFTTRIITDFLMIIFSVVYIFIKGYTLEKSFLVLILCIYKLIDTFADVFEGEFQLNNRLDISGKSLSLRTVISISSLLITLAITKNMYLASLVAIVFAITIVYLVDIRIINKFSELIFNFDFSIISRIILNCAPLFISSFMSTYIFNASRYAVENNMASNFHSRYTAIFLPVSTINLVIGFIFHPMLTKMASKWNEKKYNEFLKMILLILGGVVGVTIVALIGAYFLGIPVLSFLYATDLTEFKSALLILLIGGGLHAANISMYYALSVMRKQNWVMIMYGITFIVSLFVPNKLVLNYAINGAAWSFVIVIGVLFIQQVIVLMLNYTRSKKNM